MNWRLWVLLAAIVSAIVILSLLPAISQNEAYHNFADQRVLFGIPNCLNVLSNAFFLFVGVWGLRTVFGSIPFVNAGEVAVRGVFHRRNAHRLRLVVVSLESE